jgi:hypothetical protein
MAARFGNVLYWAANILAVVFLVNGMLMGWLEFQTHSIDYGPAFLSIATGFGVWLLGRVCLYGLAGR